MSRLSRRFVWSLVLILSSSSLSWSNDEPGDATGRLRGGLAEVVAGAEAEALIPVTIVLREQAPAELLRERAAAAPAGQRRGAVVDALRRFARARQAEILLALADAESQGEAASIRPLWIGNVIGADVTPALARRLAARSEVQHLNHNRPVDVFLGNQTCGVNAVGAPEVWNSFGYTGSGVTVAVIDTGACYNHVDLADHIWVNPGEDLDGDGVVFDPDDNNGIDDDNNGFVDDFIGWNFDSGNNDPNDNNGHGTHTSGTVLGDGTGGVGTGVAPDASLMVLRVGVQFSDELDVWNAMQYAADNAADVISMSLGWPHGTNPDRATWRTLCLNVLAAGTTMVIAAGNEGTCCPPTDHVRTPGDVPEIITVGATDCLTQLAGFSSQGPVTWWPLPPFNDYPYPPGFVKPTLVAPGVDTQSTAICSGYTFLSGTSMATPHVAGTVALMLQANPNLTPEEIKEILSDSAIDLNAPGKDNATGWGMLDAPAAVTLALGGVDQFIRGEVNEDGTVDVSDGVAILDYLFASPPATACLDAFDVNDDSAVDVSDAVYLISYLFVDGPAPSPPFPGCGVDPSGSDPLTCDAHAGCP